MEKFHLTYPVGMENGIADALGAKGIPRTIFINKEMRVVKRHSDTISYEELAAGINQILADELQQQASSQAAEKDDEC